MNKQIRELSDDELDNLQTLGLDDTFDFQCKACGRCCKNRHDILLTAYDVYKLAKILGRTPGEIIARYCEVYEGHSSHLPIVRLLPIPPDDSCPFLRNRKCSVDSLKPTVCRVYPLARIFDADSASRYYFNGSSCKHEPKTVKIRDWIGNVASDEDENAGRLWRDVMFWLIPHLQPDKAPHLIRKQALIKLVEILWIKYDMQKPFVPQLECKLKMIKERNFKHD